MLAQGARAGPWGLHGVSERAKLVGAKVNFSREAGAGTEAQVTVLAPIACVSPPVLAYLNCFRKKTRAHAY